MKKVLALILAVLMVTSCMMFTVAAEEPAEAPAADFVPLTDADAVETEYVGAWLGAKLDEENKKQGAASVYYEIAGRKLAADGTNGNIQARYDLTKGLDITGMNTLVFDLYVNDAKAIVNLTWEVFLYDMNSKYNDANCYRISGKTFEQMANKPLVNGWNRIEIDLSKFAVNGTPDLTQLGMLRLYCNEKNPVDYGVADGTLKIGFDNLYFKKAAATDTGMFVLPLLTSGTNNSFAPVATAHNNSSNRWNGLNATTQRWGGGNFKADLTQYETLEFDVYIDNAYANEVYYSLTFGSKNSYDDANVYIRSTKLKDIAGKELTVGWNHVSIDLRAFSKGWYDGETNHWNGSTYADGPFDATNVDFFAMYNDKTFIKDYTAPADEPMVTVQVVNAFLVEGDDYINVSEFTNATARMEGAFAATAAAPGKECAWPNFDSAPMKDIDGDGEKEWVVKDVAGSTSTSVAYSGTPYASYKIYMQNMSPALDVSKVTHVSIDVYCKLGANDTLKATDVQLKLRLKSANDGDNNHVTMALDLANAQALGNNWYRVKVPVTDLAKTGTVSLNYINEISVGLFGFSSKTVTDGFTYAIDNLRYYEEEIVVEEEEEELPTMPEGAYAITLREDGYKPGHGYYTVKNLPHNNSTGRMKGFVQSTTVWGGGSINVDLTEYATVEFDVYIDNAYANDVYYTLNFSSADDFQEKNVMIRSKTLRELAGYELVVGEWNHVMVDLCGLVSGSHYSHQTAKGDVTSIKYFAMYNDTTWLSNYTAPADEPEVNIQVMNMCLVKSPYTVISEFTDNRDMSTWEGALAATAPSTNQSVAGWPNSSSTTPLTDVDGDGDKEWRVAQKSGESTTNIAYGGKSAAAYNLNFNGVETDFSNVKYISIDVYCKLGAGETTLKATDVVATLRLNNAADTKFDWNETNDSYHAIKLDLNKATPLGNDWYRVMVPMSEVIVHNGTGKADLNKVDVMTIGYVWNNDVKSFADGWTYAVDNLRFWTGEERLPIVTEKPVVPAEEQANFSGASLVLNDNFAFLYNANIKGAADAYVEFTFTNYSVTVPGVAGATDATGLTNYTFRFDGILAHQLARPINAKLYALDSNGVLMTDAKLDYSVKQYCANKLADDDTDAKTKTLVSDALIYGAATQKYANVILPELITKDLEDVLTPSGTEFAAQALENVCDTSKYSSGAEWWAATLVLDNTMKIRFYFKAETTDDLTVYVNGSNKVQTVNSFEYSDKNKAYYFDIPVMATEYADVISVDFEAADTDGYGVNYSVNHYLAKTYQAEGNTDVYNDLLLAIYKYGATAAAY